jgi:hypothetical protein
VYSSQGRVYLGLDADERVLYVFDKAKALLLRIVDVPVPCHALVLGSAAGTVTAKFVPFVRDKPAPSEYKRFFDFKG